jgi:hypothetical protein
MLTSSARPLILTFGALLALFDLVALLPGNPAFSSAPGFLFAVVVQALIVWRLLHRSAIAWSLAVLGSVLYAASFVLFGGPYETTFMVSCLLTLLQIGFLFTPPVLSYVFSEDDAVVSH